MCQWLVSLEQERVITVYLPVNVCRPPALGGLLPMKKSFGYIQLDHAVAIRQRLDRNTNERQQPTVQHLLTLTEFEAKQ